ncbi:hypothetical protein R1sor_002972 [Riccia sorocarpa]|uniref:RNA-dependent RNA polymerase n=1 Tax=Riccia sorocarpa TaxID=122646 RepID=A0ABD3H3J4_9MARC
MSKIVPAYIHGQKGFWDIADVAGGESPLEIRLRPLRTIVGSANRAADWFLSWIGGRYALPRWDEQWSSLVFTGKPLAEWGFLCLIHTRKRLFTIVLPLLTSSSSAAIASLVVKEENCAEYVSRKCASEVRVYERVVTMSIPHLVDEDELRQALELVLGDNAVLSCKIFRHQMSGRSRGIGQVRFREENVTARAVKLSKEGRFVLYNQKLKFVLLDKKLEHTAPSCRRLENCTVHVGCLGANDRMLSLWNYRGLLELELDLEEQTLSIHVGYTSMDYRLEFPLSQIRQSAPLDVNRSNHGFLIQIREVPPYLYRRPFSPSQTDDKYVDVFINGCLPQKLAPYGSENWRRGWVRCTDFTPSSVIGDSSVYVIELDGSDYRHDILSLLQQTLNFSEVSKSLQVEEVPSEAPEMAVSMWNPGNFRLPFGVLYKVNNLIQYGKLSWPKLDERFCRVISTGSQSAIKLALQALSYEDECHDPVKFLRTKLDEMKKVAPPVAKLKEGMAWIHRVLVTPSKAYCIGPEMEQSNRIVRQFEEHSDRFLRVQFVDEDWGPLTSTALTSDVRSGHSEIYRRIKKVLKDGIHIGGRKYEFLAFSASQLRDSQLWMFAEKLPKPGTAKPAVTAESIRLQMGDFSQIRNVAKCAARMGQCFSASTPTRKVLPLQVKRIKDITVKTDGVVYCFSDGIGKISQDFARSIAETCGSTGRTPSAFQIRYGGYKGMVAVDPHASSAFKLYLRPSMRKFDSSHFSLEVLDYTRVLPCFLNRQVISLLSTLGVKDHVFIDLQKQVLKELDLMVEDGELARKVISCRESNSLALQLLEHGYTSKTEPLLNRLLWVFRDAEVQELRAKAKIFVSKARLLIGCLDETNTLKYGEVFVQVSGTSYSGGSYYAAQENNGNRCKTSVVTEKVFIAKNPCLHPGDVRVLQAVDVPGLHHMVDCVVFPQVGPKPHPHECSGSDLDGDQYMVSWEDSLIPPSVDDSMDYSPPAATVLDHPVTIEEIQEFFVNYIANDNLGVIANAHVVHADKENSKARSEKCLELAHLASLAVDFPKTGVPAIIPPELRPREYPDFMEKEHRVSYISNGVLGKLYRAITCPSKTDAMGMLLDSSKFFDKDMEVPGYEKHVESALSQKNIYDMKLLQLMSHYGIREEAEIIGGHVLSMSKIFARKQVEVLPKVRKAFEALQVEARTWFYARGFGKSDGVEEAKASAWYYVTYHRDYTETTSKAASIHFFSFPWAVAKVLFKIKRSAGKRTERHPGKRQKL